MTTPLRMYADPGCDLLVGDVEAVRERLGLDRLTLLGNPPSAMAELAATAPRGGRWCRRGRAYPWLDDPGAFRATVEAFLDGPAAPG